MKKRILNALQGFSRAMVQPILLLSVLGLVAILGVLLINPALTSVLPFLKLPIFAIPGSMLYSSILWIFQNLSLFFCIGIASAYAKDEKHQAGLIAAVGYFIYLVGNNTYLKATGGLVDAAVLTGSGQTMSMGLQVQDTGVFAGLLFGVLVGLLFRKYCNINFKGVGQIFSGARFVMVLTVITALCLSFAVAWVWPVFQSAISSAVGFIKESGPLGLFTYGAMERILIPTGLHHLVYSPFFFTEIGGVAEISGQTYQGAMPIFLAELNAPEVTKFSSSILYTGLGMSKIFGLMGAAYAIYRCAPKQNRNKVRNILLPSAITAFLVGITEPLEFAFIFAAPILFIVHALLAGTGLAVLSLLNLTPAASGGFIQQAIYNLTAGIDKSGWPLYLLIGILQMLIYFFIFSFLIKKLKLKTLGREDKEKSDVAATITIENQDSLAETIIRGLGGMDNILEVQSCFTRLRVDVKDVQLVNNEILKETENSGIIHNENNIQIIFGLQVANVKKAVQSALKGGN